MHTHFLPLISSFEHNANPAQAAPMKKYMRDQFQYLGIKSPQFKILMKEHIAEYGLPPVEELDAAARELWRLPYREFQYAATSLIGREEHPPYSTTNAENYICYFVRKQARAIIDENNKMNFVLQRSNHERE